MSASKGIECWPCSSALRYSSEPSHVLSALTTAAPERSSPSAMERPMPLAAPSPRRHGPRATARIARWQLPHARAAGVVAPRRSQSQSVLLLLLDSVSSTHRPLRRFVWSHLTSGMPALLEEDRHTARQDGRVEVDGPPADPPVVVYATNSVVPTANPPRLVPQLASLPDDEAALHRDLVAFLLADQDIGDDVAGHRHRGLHVREPGLVLCHPCHEGVLVVLDDRVAGRGHLPLDVLGQRHEVLDVVGEEVEPLLEPPFVEEVRLTGQQLFDCKTVFDAQHLSSS